MGHLTAECSLDVARLFPTPPPVLRIDARTFPACAPEHASGIGAARWYGGTDGSVRSPSTLHEGRMRITSKCYPYREAFNMRYFYILVFMAPLFVLRK